MSIRVLIVEDSSAMRAFVRATLESELDVEIEEAESGFQALRILPRSTFDVVLVDINMPDINGLELISFMRNSDAHAATPVVIVSTEASARDRRRGQELGANAFVAKPFAPDELLEVVEQLTRKVASGE